MRIDAETAEVLVPPHITAKSAFSQSVAFHRVLTRSGAVFARQTRSRFRLLAQLATEKNLATQMGTQMHAGANCRRVAELVRSGAIGKVSEVHVWCARAWSGGRYSQFKAPPANLNWDLWLGPAPEREYGDGIHPAEWRRFWSYEAGTLGDMACQHLHLAFWALNVRHSKTIRAEGPPVDAIGARAWLIVQHEFAAHRDRPAVRITWYDGGKRPCSNLVCYVQIFLEPLPKNHRGTLRTLRSNLHSRH